jgi:hypothetical protein
MIISSCIPEPESPKIEVSENSQLMKVREWFEEYKTTLRLPERGSNFRTDAQELILPFFEKEPDWDKFHHYYFPDGREVFEVSLENATKYFPKSMLESFPNQNPADFVIQNIMFIKHETAERFDPVIARYFPENESQIKLFESISYNRIPYDWSGKLEVFTYDEHFFVGFEIKEGIFERSYTYQEVNGDKRKTQYNMDVRCTTVYFPVGYQTCSGGHCTTTIERFVGETSCSGSSGSNFIYNSGSGSDGRPSGTPDGGSCSTCEYDPPKIPEPNFKISNKISFREYPCLSSSVNKAVDKNFSNEIQDLILDVFGESEDFNIVIEAFDFKDNKLDGTTFLSGGNPSEGYATFTISINTFLNNTSREYITATVFHEFLHAYIDYLGLPNIRPNDQADHEEMAMKYLEKLSSILIDQYGIRKSHAEALSWGGLGETKAFNDLYDSEKISINQINKDYKYGNKGTKCN